ncbi:MAG: matrixin family metalloprotease, partial [Candidatus Saccharibacteria bacterium]|nr:matrixin family metalloprotease [Pseudorhodobacter sp.]
MTTLFEDADAPSDISTTYGMTAGDEFYGINAQGESDWIRISLQVGQTYSFGLVGIGAAHSGVIDPLLKLYAANGALLDADDDGGPGRTASLTYTADETGTYFIEAKALISKGDGIYGLAVSAGTLPIYSTEMGAAIIGREGDSWADAPATAVTVTWGVRASGPAEDANGAATTFIPLTEAQIVTTRLALNNFSDVAQVSFTEVNPGGTTDNATILVGAYQSRNDGAGAFAYFPGATNAGSAAGDLWINNDSVSQTNLPVGTYDYWVFLHELGHAMGLAHPGDYNAAPGVTITYKNAAQYAEDSNQYTVMSYFDATDTAPKAPDSYADTLMMHDIYALQNLYGVNHDTRAGNDTYGFNATLGGAY